MWIEPILDRTQEDVNRVSELYALLVSGDISDEELIEWLEDSKGAFNKSDMERIVNNISVLDELLETNLTLPEVIEFPTVEWFTLVVADTQVIRDAYLIHTTTPETPSQPINTFSKVNDIEQILYDVYEIFISNSNFFYYSGSELSAGEEIGLLE